MTLDPLDPVVPPGLSAEGADPADAPGRDPDRPRRFPLKLGATVPVPRRLVGAPALLSSGSPVVAAGVSEAAARGARPVPEAPRAVVASPGVGMDSRAFRLRMVERLRRDGCVDEGVLEAMGVVPRHQFVDAGLAGQAYEDTSLPIGLGQTISKPTVVARMLSLLRHRPGGTQLSRVLEIGTGCGYQAALLSMLARQAYSVERLRALYDRARDHLAPIRADNLRLIYGDGRLGHPPNAPYDGIIAAACGEALPPAWLEQLAVGGRLVAPVHEGGGNHQVLMVVDRLADGRLVHTVHEGVRFVPLESGTSESGQG
ncbi:protein-L-isoaspartate(D-aspartate) O-methyltransferase [Sphaerotilus hippei]|uniref:Protein-L-isoaspartate O-methyltransferase n=1 Tax=Sphaerotilus hippei TaxID=744406 RepID=A0A318GZ37_9BURK|nr:protein-L-isoaspartate(D-aspartate) O-methyltransferase [Sphaerotilus hippei]PXW95261.1 protein-L-isoaspartate(D-aspartate) O-methyltransferase [Sphaerotilus hippei]